ncbi:hypothetical protein ACWENA_15820 [Streptomyces sp. NPDC004779]
MDLPSGRGALAVRPLAVITSGERWPDGPLRPAPEDDLGAGALPDVPRAPAPGLSPTPAATDDPAAALHGCGTGRELYEYGCPEDVAVAAGIDGSTTVPVLAGGAFTEAP